MAVPGEKLWDPSSYGTEEYLIVSLAAFVVFVAIKHLIFHTFYFWWYCNGQFYVPDKYWSLVTGENLPQRVLKFVTSNTKGNDILSVDKLLSVVDSYFKTKEFAPSLSTVKGKVVDDIIVQYKPNSVLVVGCHVGYVLLQIMRSLPRDAKVVTIEPNQEFIVSAKALLGLVGLEDKVMFICAEATEDLIRNLRSDYGVDKLDFVFLNRTKHDAPSHVPLLEVLEGRGEDNGYFYTNTKSKGDDCRRSVVLADKVVLPGDPEFLKYVRASDLYETKYHQMSLEHSSHEIVDGMEMAVYIG